MTSVCAIIGADERLGRLLAARFAYQAHDIALISSTEAASATALKAAHTARADANAQFFQADTIDPEAIELALADVAREMGDIDILIYSARGEFARCEPLDMTYEALEDVFQLEIVGALAAAKSVLPAMRERGAGSIFFTSAIATFRKSDPFPFDAIDDFGLRALSYSLSKTYALDGVHYMEFDLECDLDAPVCVKCMAIVLIRTKWQTQLMSRKRIEQ